MSSTSGSKDLSNGWEAIADEFLSVRSRLIGAATVKNWAAKSLEPGQVILDVGCGFGGPYTQDLIDKKLVVHAIDASRTLLQEYQKRYPSALAKHEAAEVSPFFDKKFDAILCVGLVFLLPREDQVIVLQKMAHALKEGGKLLFSAPHKIGEWDDLLTGRKSVSLGRDMYVGILRQHGFSLVDEHTDEGMSHYYEFQKDDRHTTGPDSRK